MFGPKRQTITGERRKLYKDELVDWYSSPNIIRLIIVRGMRDGACGTFGGVEKCLQNIREKLTERDHLRRPRVDGGGIVLEYVLNN